ncbi:MAG: tRNA-dihydrouridine synthase, partial [Oscillospiraceae bacterium]
MYKLPARPEFFPEDGPWPLCYNGDVFTAEAARALEARFPGMSALMLGRGAAANPALFSLIRGGGGVEREALRAFHDEIYDTCCRDFGSAGSAMLRMKELWGYLRCLFPDSAKAMKRLAKTRRPEEYVPPRPTSWAARGWSRLGRSAIRKYLGELLGRVSP